MLRGVALSEDTCIEEEVDTFLKELGIECMENLHRRGAESSMDHVIIVKGGAGLNRWSTSTPILLCSVYYHAFRFHPDTGEHTNSQSCIVQYTLFCAC